MKKEKMYDPEKVGTFKMMFGFAQPGLYRYQKLTSIKKTKIKKK